MSEDKRLRDLIKIVEDIKTGNFNVDFHHVSDDDISKLGDSIVDLGKLLEKNFLEMKKLLSVTSKVNSGLLLEEVLNYLFDNFRDLIPYNRIGCSFLSDDQKVLTAVWAKSDAETIYLGKGYIHKMYGSTLEKIIETKEPRVINDLKEYYTNHPNSDSTKLILDEGVRSSLTCPLIVNTKPVGFIFFSSFKKNTYNNIHIEIFQQIAGQISVIIEKSKLYSEILDQKKKLEELNEIKNKFLGMAAHDLRNPLGVIMGFSEFLLTDPDSFSKEELKEIFTEMHASSLNALTLVNDFLDVSKIESGTFSVNMINVNFNSYVNSIIKKNQIISKNKNIRIDLTLPNSEIQIELDTDRMAQVFNNLISNAVKFSYPNSVIKVFCFTKGDELFVDVVDNGTGLKSENVNKIFSGFFVQGVAGTKGEKSTGLGLAICKKIVDAHHGKILVKSEFGKGSTFTLVLPLKNR